MHANGTVPHSRSYGELRPGEFLGRYELLIRIGSGGMADLWLAKMSGGFGFQKLVAIKTIRARHASDSVYRAMFLDEAAIAARVRHANVAEVYDVGEDGDILYQVLEWIDGDSLSALHRVASRRHQLIPELVVLQIVSQVCAGLHVAHELRAYGRSLEVVHRDVSPQNVLISLSGDVKLIDFGIAKAAARISEETNCGIIKGKTSYLAPEQARAEEVDRRADIWACGVMLYQLVTGNLPFGTARTPTMTLETLAHLKEAPTIPNDPYGLNTVLARSLAPQKEDRFATAAEMERALQNCVQKAGGVTSAEICQALAPFREQNQARRVVIEDALERSHTGEHPIGLFGSLPPRPSSRVRLSARALERSTIPAPSPSSIPPTRISIPMLPAVAMRPSTDISTRSSLPLRLDHITERESGVTDVAVSVESRAPGARTKRRWVSTLLAAAMALFAGAAVGSSISAFRAGSSTPVESAPSPFELPASDAIALETSPARSSAAAKASIPAPEVPTPEVPTPEVPATQAATTEGPADKALAPDAPKDAKVEGAGENPVSKGASSPMTQQKVPATWKRTPKLRRASAPKPQHSAPEKATSSSQFLDAFSSRR